MSIRSFKTSSIKTGEKRSKFWDQTTVIFDSDYELISTTVLGSDTASVTFSNLGDYSSTYKHLQVRATIRSSETGIVQPAMRLNSVTSNAYSEHHILGNGSSVSSYGAGSTNRMPLGATHSASSTANAFSGYIIDLLDCYSTSKNTTARIFNGGNRIGLFSAGWFNTASLTTIEIYMDGGTGNLVTGSRLSLYGIKG